MTEQHEREAFEVWATKAHTVEIRNSQNKSYWLNLVGGILTQGGDLPLTEAAKTFFAELQKIAELNHPQPNDAEVVEVMRLGMLKDSEARGKFINGQLSARLLDFKSIAQAAYKALSDNGYRITKIGE